MTLRQFSQRFSSRWKSWDCIFEKGRGGGAIKFTLSVFASFRQQLNSHLFSTLWFPHIPLRSFPSQCIPSLIITLPPPPISSAKRNEHRVFLHGVRLHSTSGHWHWHAAPAFLSFNWSKIYFIIMGTKNILYSVLFQTECKIIQQNHYSSHFDLQADPVTD